MPTICTFFGIVIQMFWREHGPPHSHALYGEHEAVIDIRELRVTRGSLPAEHWHWCSNGPWSTAQRYWRTGTYAPADAPKTYSTAGVMPAPSPAAPWRVVSAEPLPGMCLRVTFRDGTSGEVRQRPFIDAPQVRGTIFEALRDPSVFQQVRVDLGAVGWPNGADLAPDAMYDAIRAQGHWVVGE